MQKSFFNHEAFAKAEQKLVMYKTPNTKELINSEKYQIFYQKSGLKFVNKHFEPLPAIEELCDEI